ncbi:uncharacterized protein BT62DRAFT_131432 [Guyanagaster necrorhizus]|uniref:Uncharacterized protein n=1 Tax=Guyanagaster necrorhizus TaxID=856835 RepID=A0A9P7VTX3_9AGAR|nr:uncharacterized protein BT62DRAFT_131432 [Guyanagaster necrorhizus MCA 3950]KAG7446650.1 hypothetical protein BT62DRAFT_131432 [Guyanagaster necrorhizus MCA 3950]
MVQECTSERSRQTRLHTMPIPCWLLSLMLDPSPQLPPELVHAIISAFWYRERPSRDRIVFMTTCPLINSLWKDVFAHITSRDIHVPTARYLLYLSSIIRNNNSLIYELHLPNSTRTITCHVDLVKSNDAAQESYTILSNLPNYIGFRKCFPNITQIVLEIRCRFRRGWYLLILSRPRMIWTRISIALDQAPTQLSVLPVDWEIITYKPARDFIYRECCIPTWVTFLDHVTRSMAPDALLDCVRAVPFEDMISRSAYWNSFWRVSGRGVHTETKGDVRGINRRFGKTVRRPFSSLWAFFAEAYEDITWMDNTVRERSNWRDIVSP